MAPLRSCEPKLKLLSPASLARSRMRCSAMDSFFSAEPYCRWILPIAARDAMEAGPLMDEQGFVRKVEAAYREMFDKWARTAQLTSQQRWHEIGANTH